MIRQENCWFFSSMVQELLIRNFGGQYRSGSLNNPKLALERRTSIVSKAYREFSHEIDCGADAVLKLSTSIGEAAISEAVKSRLDNLRHHHVRYKPLVSADADQD